MTYSVDDTQPGAPAPASGQAPNPFQGDPINLRPTINPEDDGGRPPRGGCLMPGFVALILLGVAVAIVALSALAGWTSGTREANANASATRNFEINEQVQFIPGDVQSGNTVLLDARVRWLATLTPGVPGMNDYIMTATAVYLNTLPTATLPVTATPETAATAQPTEELAISQQESGGYDLARILSQAEAAAASSQWQDTIDLLDVILGTDESFESQRVNTLMSQALNSYARELYNANRPAEANLIVARAREFGQLAEGLAYEAMAAELYLTARTAVGTGSPSASSSLQALLDLGPGRYYQEAQTLLYDLYVAQGDAYVAQNNPCSAVGSYQRATQVFASGVANGKLAAAQNACANTPPTVDPNIIIPSDQPVAPVGQVQ
jgi:hypothetical protein